MIAMLVLEDERHIYEMLSSVLHEKGYSCTIEENNPSIVEIRRQAMEERAPQASVCLKSILDENKGHAYKATMLAIEKPLIEAVLKRTESNQLRAARILGINRNTLRSKIKKYAINHKQYKAVYL